MPSYHLTVEVSHFFQKPPDYPQFIGEYRVATSESGEIVFGVVSITSPDGAGSLYMKNDEGDFVNKTVEEVDKELSRFIHAMSEKYDDLEFDFEEYFETMMPLEDSAVWQKLY